ncbi:reverse transcriptase domain-containing protein [Tanacetum coccineum]
MDDESMWATDHVVALTPSSIITIPETANEFAIKGNHLTLVKGNQFDRRTKTDPHKHIHEFLEAKTWLDELNEGTIEIWDELRTAFISRIRNSKTMLKTKPDLDEDDIPMPREEEARFMQTFPKNMLVEVGKFTFLSDFVILEMEEDSKVPLILGRPFLHIVDAVIRVKQKQLNLGVRIERIIFNIDSAMKHSYSNDDTCFSIDVIDEILEEDFDALLNEGSKILHSIK